MIEREVKLLAPPTFELPDLTVAAAGRPVAVLAPQVLRATYYDTDDLRLLRWGVTVRHRTGDEGGPVWTVKVPAGAGGTVVARNELEFRGRPGTVPTEVAQLLRGFVRLASLGPVATLETRRQRVQVRDAHGRALLEVADDAVVVIEGPRAGDRFREVEVELGADCDGDDLLEPVVGRLVAAGATEGAGAPKVVWALGPAATAPPEVEPVSPDRQSTAGEVVRAAVATAVIRLLQHEVGARLGDDPEDVHQARVATRRLRSDLRTFRSYVDKEWAGAVREELRWVGGVLGAVRDADVLLERLRAQVDRLPEPDRRPGQDLLRRLADEREAARADLLGALAGDRYAELVQELVLAARVPRLTAEAASPGRTALPEVVRRPWKHLDGAVSALGKAPTDAQLHEIRIRAKRARYAAEAVAPVVGKPARRLAAALAQVQSVLGDLQDGAVAEAWLRTRAAGADGTQALAAGQLIAVQHQEMDMARRRWRAAWKSASKKSLRSWLT